MQASRLILLGNHATKKGLLSVLQVLLHFIVHLFQNFVPHFRPLQCLLEFDVALVKGIVVLQFGGFEQLCPFQSSSDSNRSHGQLPHILGVLVRGVELFSSKRLFISSWSFDDLHALSGVFLVFLLFHLRHKQILCSLLPLQLGHVHILHCLDLNIRLFVLGEVLVTDVLDVIEILVLRILNLFPNDLLYMRVSDLPLLLQSVLNQLSCLHVRNHEHLLHFVLPNLVPLSYVLEHLLEPHISPSNAALRIPAL